MLSFQTKAQFLGQSGRPVTSAVPFLTITPDARSGAMGDAGVAISPDANANYWNPSKIVFNKSRLGAAISYNPWLRNLVNDMSLSYLSGYYKLNDRQAFGAALTYFNLGDIEFTDENGGPIRSFNPREFAFQPTFSQKLSDYLSVGVGIRFIHSNLAGNFDFTNFNSKPGNTVSGDVSLYYNRDVNWGGRDINLAFGANLSNLGPKVTYSDRDNREFIPTNLRLGTAITYNIDPYNKFTLALDFNKLLVPTPPVYDTVDGGIKIVNGKPVVRLGADPSRSFLSGVFGSFSDAPDGFKEELQEVAVSTGLEYWYKDLFAVRGGYFYENKLKGNRQYFTLGAGLRYSKVGLDFAYLIPRQQNNPLAETLRFTLHLQVGAEEESN
ncbi:MAG TPA: type IX secretion system outer membrane channel protein PorV [Cytophagales bacterium]